MQAKSFFDNLLIVPEGIEIRIQLPRFCSILKLLKLLIVPEGIEILTSFIIAINNLSF
jgi:hypothetical protein